MCDGDAPTLQIIIYGPLNCGSFVGAGPVTLCSESLRRWAVPELAEVVDGARRPLGHPAPLGLERCRQNIRVQRSHALIRQVWARDCSSSAFPKARSSRIGCILTCGSAPGSWVKSAWLHLRPNAHDWSRSVRYDVPQHLAPETSDALRFCAVEGDLDLLDRRRRPTIEARPSHPAAYGRRPPRLVDGARWPRGHPAPMGLERGHPVTTRIGSDGTQGGAERSSRARAARQAVAGGRALAWRMSATRIESFRLTAAPPRPALARPHVVRVPYVGRRRRAHPGCARTLLAAR